MLGEPMDDFEMSESKANIIERMHDDELGRIICQNTLLVRFGCNQYKKLGRAGCGQINQRQPIVALLLKESDCTTSKQIKAMSLKKW